MTNTRFFMLTSAALLALILFACGGGGGGSSGELDGIATEVIPDEPAPSAPQSEEMVVVRYDYDGDGDEDLLTLDVMESPYVIAAALETTATGEVVDVTDDVLGQAVDPEISGALAAYLAESMAIASGHELDVTTASGDVTVTVFE